MDATKDDPIAFFLLNGSVLALCDKKSLAEYARLDHVSSGFPGFTLARNTNSAEDVDINYEQVHSTGARVVKHPHKAEWGGYSGYFAGPDGYLWEVVYNPPGKLTRADIGCDLTFGKAFGTNREYH